MQTLKQQLDAAHARAARLEKKLATLMAKDAASAALERHGVRHNKLLHEHIAASLRARDLDATRPKLVVVDPDSGNDRSIDIDGLMAELRASADFGVCFTEPKGKESKPAKVTVANPWLKGSTFNATEQSKLLRSNPALAAQLQEEAGVLIPPTRRF